MLGSISNTHLIAILKVVPLILLDEFAPDLEVIGIPAMFVIVAIGVIILITLPKGLNVSQENKAMKEPVVETPKNKLKQSIQGLLWTCTILVFFLLNYMDISSPWLIFVIAGLGAQLIEVLMTEEKGKSLKTIVSELIDINTSSGKVEIGTVQGKGNIKLSSGKNTYTKLDGAFDIKITSGKLNVTQFTGSSNIKLSSGKLTFNESSFLNESTIKVTSGKVDINTDPSTLFCFGTSVTSGKADTPESSCKDPNAIDFKIKVSSGKVTITND